MFAQKRDKGTWPALALWEWQFGQYSQRYDGTTKRRALLPGKCCNIMRDSYQFRSQSASATCVCKVCCHFFGLHGMYKHRSQLHGVKSTLHLLMLLSNTLICSRRVWT
jgi:hypothetical protein